MAVSGNMSLATREILAPVSISILYTGLSPTFPFTVIESDILYVHAGCSSRIDLGLGRKLRVGIIFVISTLPAPSLPLDRPSSFPHTALPITFRFRLQLVILCDLPYHLVETPDLTSLEAVAWSVDTSPMSTSRSESSSLVFIAHVTFSISIHLIS